MKLGVFTQWIRAASVEDLARRISELDLQCVVLDSYPGLDINLDDPSAEHCQRIKDAFATYGVEIAAIGGYDNLVHIDLAERQKIHARFKGLMKLCAGIGSPMVCAEMGTFHPTSGWDWDPANVSNQALEALVEAVRSLLPTAREHNVIMGLEPYVMTIGYTPERAAYLMATLDSPYVRLVCDPAGMLHRVTLEEQETFLPAAFRLLSPYIGLVHVEDCRPDPNGHFLWLPAGKGMINYPLFMRLVIQSGYRGPLILEHLSEADLPAARSYVLQHYELASQQLIKEGVSLA